MLVTALLGAGWPLTAAAHPHVFIDVKVEVVFDEGGQVTGLRETWTFDELYTAFAAGDLDANGDGEADADKLAELLTLNLTNLRDYDYFTRVEGAKGRVALGDASEGRLWVEWQRLRMTFLVPLAKPAEIAENGLRYAVYDPTYYVELLHSGGPDAVVLTAGPASCSYAVHAPNPNPETMSLAASLDRTETAGDGLGIHFAEWVSVQCR